jgi:hypothetical protein
MKANDRKRPVTTADIATALPLKAPAVTAATVQNVLLDIDAALLAELHRVTCALAAVAADGPPPPRTRASVQEPLKKIAATLRDARTQIANIEARL